MEYLDVVLGADSGLNREAKPGYAALAYVVSWSMMPDPKAEKVIKARELAVHDRAGKGVSIAGAEPRTRVIFLTGRPINEPIAWYGPIVMNYENEVEQALRELLMETSLRKRRALKTSLKPLLGERLEQRSVG